MLASKVCERHLIQARPKIKPIATPPNPILFLSAGEASGDLYGAQLIAELARRLPQATFLGLGGTEMEAAGQRRIVRAEDVAVMGITEILRHIPRIVAAYRRLVRALRRERPALAILIDFPDVNFRLAKHCKRLDIPVLWLVSPQLWAWKRRRLRWVQQRVAKMLVIFPFEAPFYRARNVDAEFIGHPLASLPMPTITREEYAAEHNLDPSKTWIALLPGSRWKEIKPNLREMLGIPFQNATSDNLNLEEMLEQSRPSPAVLDYQSAQFLLPVASTIHMKAMQNFVDKLSFRWTNYSESTDPDLQIHLVRDARAALHHSRAAIIASGTATVQALTLGIPFVVVYRVSRLTYSLAKRLISYPPEVWPQTEPSTPYPATALPIAMPNLIAGRRIVPELLNDNFTAPKVAAALKPLLTDTPERTRMIADLAETRARLLTPGPKTPIERAADAATTLLSNS